MHYYAVTEPSRSYCIAVKLTDPRLVPQQMYITADEPMRSLRSAGKDGDVLIVAGSGHSMGKAVDTRLPYEDLEEWTRTHFPVKEGEWRLQTVAVLAPTAL